MCLEGGLRGDQSKTLIGWDGNPRTRFTGARGSLLYLEESRQRMEGERRVDDGHGGKREREHNDDGPERDGSRYKQS